MQRASWVGKCLGGRERGEGRRVLSRCGRALPGMQGSWEIRKPKPDQISDFARRPLPLFFLLGLILPRRREKAGRPCRGLRRWTALPHRGRTHTCGGIFYAQQWHEFSLAGFAVKIRRTL